MERNGRSAQEVKTAGPVSAAEFNTAMVHLYRAEVTKANSWRQRLDTTTNWAVITLAAAITFALGGPEPERHVVILLDSILVTLFLFLEARRYRHYDIWQTRVHLMESDYFAPMLWPEGAPCHREWKQMLALDLRQPKYHISYWEALGWRLRRNYVWLYVTLLATWVIKIGTYPGALYSLDEFLARAALGPVPGWTVVGIGLAFNGALIVLAIITAGMRSASGEIITPRETRAKIQKSVEDVVEGG